MKLTSNKPVYKLSTQGVASIMMALNKGLLEKVDITQLLLNFNMVEETDGLKVLNPPVLELEKISGEFEKKAIEKKTRKIRKEVYSMKDIVED